MGIPRFQRREVQREYNTAAWENKLAECDQLSDLSKEAQDNEEWHRSTYLFEQSMKCMEEL